MRSGGGGERQVKRIEVNEADLREFMAAAQEVREEGAGAEIPGTPGMVPGDAFNSLEPGTEDRFARALDALNFDLDRSAR